MATYIRQLTDNAGNNILPATRAEGVYFQDNTTLDSIMSAQAGVVAKALGDKNGKDITSYVTNLTSKGTTVTFTKGDGSTGSFTTQDTTYAEASDSQAGLMSATDKAKLNGIANNANNYTHPSHTAAKEGLYKVTVDALGHVTATTAVAKGDITALGIPAQDTTYNAFKGATGAAAGAAGLVPAPAQGDQAKFLKADGTWATPANTTYGEATTETAGLMSAADKKKLDGVEAGANKYTHPSYTPKASGLYKVTVDATGHVSAAAAVEKGDITALGIPAKDTTYNAFKGATAAAAGGAGLVPAPAQGDQAKFLKADGTWATPANTTYGEATTETAGLMSAADKKKLDGVEAGANKYTHPSYTPKASGLYKVTVDATGHVSAAAAVEKSDITALGIPGQDTTYQNATQSKAGLMSAADKTKLDNIPTSALGYASNWGAEADDLPARPIA